ncbi:MAG: hypothetical protein HUK21_10050 [Fibrobacteraceae bacterium]|nr:hypothetical protein [Fibrobacteraceae bacterium]
MNNILRFLLKVLLIAIVPLLSCGCYHSYEVDITGVNDEKTVFAYLTDYSDKELKFDVRTSNSDIVEIDVYYDDGLWHTLLSLDIEGCRSFSCEDAKSILIHDNSYRYNVLLKSEDFKISSKTSESYDSDYLLTHLFNLKIEAEGISIDWDVLVGEHKEGLWYIPSFPIWG